MKASTTSRFFDAPTVNAIIKNNKLSNLKTIELKSDQQPYIYFLFADNQKEPSKICKQNVWKNSKKMVLWRSWLKNSLEIKIIFQLKNALKSSKQK